MDASEIPDDQPIGLSKESPGGLRRCLNLVRRAGNELAEQFRVLKKQREVSWCQKLLRQADTFVQKFCSQSEIWMFVASRLSMMQFLIKCSDNSSDEGARPAALEGEEPAAINRAAPVRSTHNSTSQASPLQQCANAPQGEDGPSAVHDGPSHMPTDFEENDKLLRVESISGDGVVLYKSPQQLHAKFQLRISQSVNTPTRRAWSSRFDSAVEQSKENHTPRGTPIIPGKLYEF